MLAEFYMHCQALQWYEARRTKNHLGRGHILYRTPDGPSKKRCLYEWDIFQDFPALLLFWISVLCWPLGKYTMKFGLNSPRLKLNRSSNVSIKFAQHPIRIRITTFKMKISGKSPKILRSADAIKETYQINAKRWT